MGGGPLQECGPARAGGGGPERRRCRSRGCPTWGLHVQATGPASSCRTGKGTQLAQNEVRGVEGALRVAGTAALVCPLPRCWVSSGPASPTQGCSGVPAARVTASPCALPGDGGGEPSAGGTVGAGVRVARALSVATPAALLRVPEEPLRCGKQACLQKSAVPGVGRAEGEQTGGPGRGGSCRRSC